MIEPKTLIQTTTELSMSRASDDTIRLSISDDPSGRLIVEITLNLEEFADFLTNRTISGCKTAFYNTGKVGLQQEVKTVKIPHQAYASDNGDMEKTFKEAEARNEGWVADREKYNNYRYDHKNKEYQVTLRRWV